MKRRLFVGGVGTLPLVGACAGNRSTRPLRVPSSAASEVITPSHSRSDPATAHQEEPSATAEAIGPRFLGRVLTRGEHQASYCWSGCGFVVRFEGTGLSLRVEDDNRHTLLIDGSEVEPVRIEKGQTEVTLCRNLTPGSHVLRLERRTEALFGTTHINGFEVHGGHLLPAPPPLTRRMEIVGDSISCGYGNLGTSPQCKFSAETENHYLAYSAVLARSLGCELSTVAWSGRGVVRNYAGEPGDTMPQMFSRVLAESPAPLTAAVSPAHVVIVNLGNNDYSTEPSPSLEVFRDGYVGLLEQIATRHPGAAIFCTTGPALPPKGLDKCLAGIEAAIGQRHSEGQLQIWLHRLQTSNEAPGCDWHPSVETHRKMAQELELAVREQLGWAN